MRCRSACLIHGGLLKLGIDIGESSVTKYMFRCPKPPLQTWRTFLENHVSQLVSIDFFTVPQSRDTSVEMGRLLDRLGHSRHLHQQCPPGAHVGRVSMFTPARAFILVLAPTASSITN